MAEAVLEACPTPKPGALSALVDDHHRRGLDIDAQTIVPNWDGMRMDRSWAVEILRLCDGTLPDHP